MVRPLCFMEAQLQVARFLNVDLDIYSNRDLAPLVTSLGRKVHCLYQGREGRRYSAHLEIAADAKSADATIRKFCRMLGSLRKAERALWDKASVRSFSVGISAGQQPNGSDFPIRSATLQQVAALDAQIVITIYPPGFYP